ncbi:LOW QUALITY PROTEIN: zinc metalloproteinase nas-33-like [Pomacea canaliculata]|uniref:LOW QUALITY PROTEIN: zinc metalloproteinase nas-33-like n=1 Tax=Pomacea canaliculata TaxID=400727 RepID=UPI000D729BC3|nr:LOW QUALITY PROTEIN: zinc metalloproteinase nas-33-like [Pomacea canaliculata]
MCMATPVDGAPTADIITHVHKTTSHTWDVWKINFNLCPPSLCGSSGESSEAPAPRPEGTGGTVFYQGDIIVDSNVARFIYPSLYSKKRRHKRATVRMRKRLWKNGVVPYIFTDTLTPMARSAVLQAFSHIHKVTCIRFRQKEQHDADFIKFISDPGCWSGIGRVGGGQLLSLGTGCDNVGTAVHEITHSLGVWHEQARSDRDKYVRVLEENVSEKFLPDFQKIGPALATSRGYPYDYRSIMHYSTHAFTRNGQPTIEVTGVGKKLGISLKSRSTLSNIDVAQLRDMYDCNLQMDTNKTVCPKSWVKHDSSCYKFIPQLKKQFAAAAKYCEDLNSHLVFIETKREDEFLAKRIGARFPAVATWRTGGRVENTTNRMVWYQKESDARQMTYSNWAKGHPDSHYLNGHPLQPHDKENRVERSLGRLPTSATRVHLPVYM